MPERARVLLVEDDAQVATTVRDALRGVQIALDDAQTFETARSHISGRSYDAVILDIGLPDGSGLELADLLRQGGSDVPILMLTAQSAVEHRLDGFAHGADDYLCKPFVAEELVARLKALLRRARGQQQHMLRYGGLELDLLRRIVHRDDQEITLSDRETALLAYLLKHAEQPIPRDEIAQEVWGIDASADSGVVNVYINYLRNKLERGGRLPRLIHTIRGVGYVLSETEPD